MTPIIPTAGKKGLKFIVQRKIMKENVYVGRITCHLGDCDVLCTITIKIGYTNAMVFAVPVIWQVHNVNYLPERI